MKIMDYGVGNLRSVEKALAHLGYTAEVTREKEQLKDARALILPGVGAFADAMENLERYDLLTVIRDHIQSGKPFLGICLGMQLLLGGSDEGNCWTSGLNVFPGEVKELPKTIKELKVPHMGWNQLDFAKESRLLQGVPAGGFVYFVHSFYADPLEPGVIAATTDYGRPVAAVLEQDNVFATQFHPEKSSDVGLRILKNFGELVTG